MSRGLDQNFRELGAKLARLLPDLFRHADGGLVVVEDNRPRRIMSAQELAPLLIDTIRVNITKDGKYQGERISTTNLNDMLRSRHFLDNFARIRVTTTTPLVQSDYTPTQPGYNPKDGVLYIGPTVITSNDTPTINTFLDVYEWESEADRTNAVAAALMVLFRLHFPGGKPLLLVSANKSHTGKTTLMEFIRGRTAKADLTYSDKDWPMQNELHEKLLQQDDIGAIDMDNVRTDSSGRGKIIRSGFFESLITNPELALHSSKSREVIRRANNLVVMLNTNEGNLSIDLLNRCLPIRINATGDLTERIARVKEKLGGLNLKLEWLPRNLDQIQAELWGMIDRWEKVGKPLDKEVKHSMGPCLQIIGGIVKHAGFKAFLANYSTTRSAADPISANLGSLAFFAGGGFKRTGELAQIAVSHGLAKNLLPGADLANEAARLQAMGVLLSSHDKETFTARDATHTITYRLQKQQGRFGQEFPHNRYRFEEIKREEIKDDKGGVVLEQPEAVPQAVAHPSSPLVLPRELVLDEYKPLTELPT